MKKFVKWFLFGLFLCGCIALVVCYMVIPERTKGAIDIVIEYLNTPIGIIGGTTITLGFVGFMVVKTLLKIKGDNFKKQLEEIKKAYEEKLALVKEYKEQGDKAYEYAKGLVACVHGRMDYIEKELIAMCQVIPNKKVNELGEKIENGSLALKNEQEQMLDKIDNNFDNYVNEQDKVKKLESKVEYLVGIVEKVVNDNGETTND